MYVYESRGDQSSISIQNPSRRRIDLTNFDNLAALDRDISDKYICPSTISDESVLYDEIAHDFPCTITDVPLPFNRLRDAFLRHTATLANYRSKRITN